MMANLRHPMHNEELYLMSLSGLIPFSRVPVCEQRLAGETVPTEQSIEFDQDVIKTDTDMDDPETINANLHDLIDWNIESDWE